MKDTIFNKDSPGKNAVNFSRDGLMIEEAIPKHLLRPREDLRLPDIPEISLVRHFTKLSRKNHGVDTGIYPLGSCTMKYNPRLHETVSGFPGFQGLHPLQHVQSPRSCQGIVRLLHETVTMLCELTGMDLFSLQPAAGAHGEFTGLLTIKNCLDAAGKSGKDKVIVPDTAHGTNPASAAVCGFEVIEITSNEAGLVDISQLEAALAGDDVAAIMLTNPNTLGLFEEEILKITSMVHEKGAYCYYDGANLNGLCGISRPGDMGFDVIHLNLHKTFSTPHGGGGPGSGPVGVKESLAPFLPGPRTTKTSDGFALETRTETIKEFHGNIGVIVRAYCYLKGLGLEGLRESTKLAVLNANYLKLLIQEFLHVPYKARCYHEFVASDEGLPNGVATGDIAKRLMDHGIHAPTVHFPLIVPGAIMVEPTETEPKEELERLASALKEIVNEANEDPDRVKGAPWTMPVRRLDEVAAARNPVLTVDLKKKER